MSNRNACLVDGCDKPPAPKRRNLCYRHYIADQYRDTPPPSDAELAARIFPKVVESESGCWEWQGAKHPRTGHGKFGYNAEGRCITRYVHIWTWEYLVGPIPDGLVIDHLCRNAKCCNPQHLEPVTQGVNTLRGEAPSAKNARKTHCFRGHEFTPGNTYILQGRYGPKRACAICIRYENNQRSRQDNRLSFFATQQEAWDEIWSRFHSNGPGSTIEATAPARDWLQRIIAQYGITSMLDAPCGCFGWMQHVNLDGVSYEGWDIQPEQIAANQKQWPHLKFERRNLLTVKAKSLPNVDLLWMRDFTLHLPSDYVVKLLNKIRSSNIRYLAVTNHPNGDNDRELPPEGHDNRPGYWAHALNLEAAPFNLTGRIDSVVEAQDGTTLKTIQEMILVKLR